MKKNLFTFLACLLAFVAGLMLYQPNSYHIFKNYRYECNFCGEQFDNTKALPEAYEGTCEGCDAAITYADLTLVGAPNVQTTFRYQCPSCSGIIERENEMKDSYRGKCPLCQEKIRGDEAVAIKENSVQPLGYYLAAAGAYLVLGGAVFGLISGTNLILDTLEFIGEKITATRYAKKDSKKEAVK